MLFLNLEDLLQVTTFAYIKCHNSSYCIFLICYVLVYQYIYIIQVNIINIDIIIVDINL
jgi:hypothetical protein